MCPVDLRVWCPFSYKFKKKKTSEEIYVCLGYSSCDLLAFNFTFFLFLEH